MKKILGGLGLVLLTIFLASCGSAVKEIENTNADYKVYSATELAASTDENNVLFFHAKWCPTCKKASNNLAQSSFPEDLTVFKVDYDNSTELKQKYGVTSQHTFVQIDSEGNMLAKWSGSRDLEDILKNLVPVVTSNTKVVVEEVVVAPVVTETETQEVEDKELVTITEVAEVSIETVAEPLVSEVVTEKKSGAYLAYSPDSVKNSEGDKVLFFHAKWCGSCVGADKNISSEEQPAGLTVFKVDYDSSSDLKKEYGVTSQHTFVQVDSDGNMIKKWFGSRNTADIVAKVN